MIGNVAVIIPVFGDRAYWDPMAERAMRSVQVQTLAPQTAFIYRANTLHEARNMPAYDVRTEWLCFLDADDELEPEYLEAALALDEGDIRYPRVRIILNESRSVISEAFSYSPVNLLQMNYIVVSALVRRELFLKVGGFRDLPFYEDWDLWIRCWQAGAKIVESRGSILQVRRRKNSRNVVDQQRAVDFSEQLRALYGGKD